MAPVKSLCESRSSSFGIFLPFFFLLSVCGDSPPTAGLALESICKTNGKDGSTQKSFFLIESNSSVIHKPIPYQRILVSLFRYFLKTHFIKRAIASEGEPNSYFQLLVHKTRAIPAASTISSFPGSCYQSTSGSGVGKWRSRREGSIEAFFSASLASPGGNTAGIRGSPSADTLRFYPVVCWEL